VREVLLDFTSAGRLGKIAMRPASSAVHPSMRLRSITLHQQDSLDLIAFHTLQRSADSKDHLSRGH